MAYCVNIVFTVAAELALASSGFAITPLSPCSFEKGNPYCSLENEILSVCVCESVCV